ncbi:MAG: hypothetical protein KBT27_08200 [Prevotellaceae bacterium]|nr:hypothetical protein [Candidatus Faecinaster equi]
MKKIGVFLILLLALNTKVSAAEFDEPTRIRCTCYTSTEGSVTASGEHVREGIVAGKREWMGKVAVLYDLNMNLIGYYEFLDTGAGIDTDGDGKGDSIKNGKSIDVYRDTLERCKEWIGLYGDYVYMEIIEAQG